MKQETTLLKTKLQHVSMQQYHGHKIGLMGYEGKRIVKLIGFAKESNGTVWGHWQFVLKKTLKPSGKSTSFFTPIH